MAKNVKVRKNTGTSDSNLIKTAAISLFSGVLTFVTFLAVFSVLIMNVNIDKNYLFLFVLISSGVSAFISSIAVCRLSSQKKLVFSLAVAIVLSVAEFLVMLCFNNASLSNLVYLLFPVAIIFGFVGCVAGMNIRK